MYKFHAPSPIKSGATDFFTVGDLSDFAELSQRCSGEYFDGSWSRDWVGGMSLVDAREHARTGHIASAVASERFMSQLENVLPAPSARAEWRNDVAGAVPNVPAFLAGQPLTMRRKVKETNEAAPIAVVCDMVLSGGIERRDMEKRGAAILALVRLLSAKRPVELYVGGSMDAGISNACHYFFRVNTAPLDLARAAFILAHPAAVRGLLYGMGRTWDGFTGKWAYNDHSIMRKRGEKVMRSMLPHLTDLIYVPGAYLTDDTIARPVEWIKANVLAALPSQDEAA